MSNKKAFLKTLENMKGKTFTYGNKIHYLVSYSTDEAREKVKIKTNLDEFERSYETASEFLTYWKETTVLPAMAAPDDNNQMATLLESENTMIGELTAVLKDNIAKVRESKDYIPQATAVNNNVNSIINLAKLKLDIYKQFKGKKK